MYFKFLLLILIGAATVPFAHGSSEVTEAQREEYDLAAKWFASATKIETLTQALEVLSPGRRWTCYDHRLSNLTFYNPNSNNHLNIFHPHPNEPVLIWGKPTLVFAHYGDDIYGRWEYTILSGELVGYESRHYEHDGPIEVIRYSKESGELIIRQGYFSESGAPNEDFTSAGHPDPYVYVSCNI